MEPINYYQILGVHPTCSVLEIKKAYRKLALQYHPDKHQNNELLTERFNEIKIAYEILIIEEKRKIFHQHFFSNSGINYFNNLATLETTIDALKNYITHHNADAIDRTLLMHYILEIVSEQTSQLLMNETDEKLKNILLQKIVFCCKPLTSKMFERVAKNLLFIFPAQKNYITAIFVNKQKLDGWHRYKLMIATIIALLFCWLMMLLG